MSNSEQSHKAVSFRSRRQVLVPPEVIAWVPGAMARRHGILPVAGRDDCLDVVSAGGGGDAALMRLEARRPARAVVPTIDPDASSRPFNNIIRPMKSPATLPWACSRACSGERCKRIARICISTRRKTEDWYACAWMD